MTDIRLLQSGSKRLLESGSNYLLEGSQVSTAVRRSCSAAFRYAGPSPNVDHHMHVVSRLEKPRIRPSRTQMMFLPGGNGVETSWQGGTTTNPSETGDVVRDAVDHLTYHRRVLTLPTNWTWGDDEMQTRIDDLFAYAEANYFFSPPYHLVGVSMGTTCALNWAVNNIDKVRSISLMLPAVDIQAMCDDNRLDSYYPNILRPDDPAAYGVRPPNDHNPADYAASLVGVPIKLWYSNNDPICLPGEATAFAAASGATAVNIGNEAGIGPGHGLDTGFTPSDVGAFLLAND